MLKKWLEDKSVTEIVALSLLTIIWGGALGYAAMWYVPIVWSALSSEYWFISTLLVFFLTVIILAITAGGIAIIAGAISWLCLFIGAIIEDSMTIMRWCYRKICP